MCSKISAQLEVYLRHGDFTHGLRLIYARGMQEGTDQTPQLEEVAAGVYSYVQPDGTWFINNMGFIVGDDSVISIDATSTQRRTQAYLDAIASVTDLPVSVLVNTHHHADHTHGNCLFTDATIVSHRTCREVMLATGIPDYSAVFPGVDWGDLSFRAPDVTFENTLTLHTDIGHTGTGRTDIGHTGTGHTGNALAGATSKVGHVELSHVGHVAHTEGDVIAWLPQSRVLFSGDLIFHGGTPFALFGSIQGTLEALDLVQSYEAEVVVPGHGPAFSGARINEVLDEQRDYLRFVQATAAEGLAAGRSPLAQSQATDLGEFERLTDSERLAGNMHVAYREAADTRAGSPDTGASSDASTGGPNTNAGSGTSASNPDTSTGTAAAEASFVAQGIADMVAYNNGELPRCVA